MLLVSIFLSCREDNDTPELDVFGEWELVKGKGSYEGEGAVQEVPDLSSAESYVFNPDNSFSKRRGQGQNQLVAKGTYSIATVEGEDSKSYLHSLSLRYVSGDQIIGDCAGKHLEGLFINRQEELVNTYGLCDGPTLWYTKK